MAKISSFEWNRQLFHIFLGLFIVLFLKFGFIDKKLILIIILIGLFLSYLSKTQENQRFSGHQKYKVFFSETRIPIVYELLEKFERKEELKKFPGKGMLFYFIGVYIALSLFPKEVAMASIMVLALGDSISHLYGLHFGKIRHPLSKTKFLEGTIAGFVFGFIGAFVFLPFWEAFFASLAAMIVEAIEIKIGTEQVDDNLIVPFVAGAAVWITRLF